jgi:hypothetical protein
MDSMNKQIKLAIALTIALLAAGCVLTSSTSTNDATASSDLIVPVTTPSPGGAPLFGSPSGMGFTTGNAAQSGGQGSGLMSFNNTGAYGTSGTITQSITN